ncbi:glycerol-3-phosphate 1-O-acyltransferase PlsY [Alicyclobacillus cellulosilyticus]|nr:glycerol-3-phosphate 1-O-acyltransferase PlsY [Alicyclobacillus cellulosilyticus]
MWLLCLLFAYGIGSISTSTIVSRVVARIDIREHGSGNAGATNTVRVLGLKWGLVVLIADVAKGVIASLLAMGWAHGTPWVVYAAGIAAIAGHNWPVFFGFRGGKGIATAIGVLSTWMLLPALAAGAVAVALLLLTRYVSLASLMFTILTPAFGVWFHAPWGAVAASAVIALLSIYRHRQNIVRLAKGKEHRIFHRQETRMTGK